LNARRSRRRQCPSRRQQAVFSSRIEGDALERLPGLDDVFDIVFLDGRNVEYERYFELVRAKLEAGALVVADDVVLHKDVLEPYSRARQKDPTLVSTTVPLDRGLELSVVLTETL
jgi:predicted O-methyltransferase YrrM